MKKISILGSTGSIGTQTLEIVKDYPKELGVAGLTTNKDNPLSCIKEVRGVGPKQIKWQLGTNFITPIARRASGWTKKKTYPELRKDSLRLVIMPSC